MKLTLARGLILCLAYLATSTVPSLALCDDTATIAGGAGGGAGVTGLAVGAYFLAKHLKNKNAANASGTEETTTEASESATKQTTYNVRSTANLDPIMKRSESTDGYIVYKDGQRLSPEEYASDTNAQAAVENAPADGSNSTYTATEPVGEDTYAITRLSRLRDTGFASSDTPASTTLSDGTKMAVGKNGSLMTPEEFAADKAAQEALKNDAIYGQAAMEPVAEATEEVAGLL
jgi:hypothetical protein